MAVKLVNLHVVWSTHAPEEGEPFDVLEVRRTDPKVAEQDVSIIKDVFRRRAWINEVAR